VLFIVPHVRPAFETSQLLEEMNYLNLEELRGFCSERGIPYKIMGEYPNANFCRPGGT
jgi:hypothetical protein